MTTRIAAAAVVGPSGGGAFTRSPRHPAGPYGIPARSLPCQQRRHDRRSPPVATPARRDCRLSSSSQRLRRPRLCCYWRRAAATSRRRDRPNLARNIANRERRQPELWQTVRRHSATPHPLPAIEHTPSPSAPKPTVTKRKTRCGARGRCHRSPLRRGTQAYVMRPSASRTTNPA